MIYFSLTILFLFSTCFTYFYIRYAWRHQLLDSPNARSSHTQLTPHGGGLIFLMLWILSTIALFFSHTLTVQQLSIFLPGTLLVASIGFFDDHYNLAARWRALAYLSAAMMSIIALGGFAKLILNENIILTLGAFGTVFTVLAVLWSINLFNFMDGLDGIAASEAIFILSVGGFFIEKTGGYEIALLAWSLSACIAGFWIWNKPPAKIFMGDVGSATLGFIVMLLALWGEKQYGVPALLWFILYGVFLVDATLTLLRRLLAGEPIYQAHRLHAYQRLNQAGFSHKKVLMMISCVNLLLALLAIFSFYHRAYLLISALIALVILLLLYGWVERVNPMYISKTHY